MDAQGFLVTLLRDFQVSLVLGYHPKVMDSSRDVFLGADYLGIVQRFPIQSFGSLQVASIVLDISEPGDRARDTQFVT